MSFVEGPVQKFRCEWALLERWCMHSRPKARLIGNINITHVSCHALANFPELSGKFFQSSVCC